MKVAEAEGCPTCGRECGERHVATTQRPSIAKMERWSDRGIAEATDGCRVEPDGLCEHGHQSWMLRLHLI